MLNDERLKPACVFRGKLHPGERMPACFVCLGCDWREVTEGEHPDPRVTYLCNTCSPRQVSVTTIHLLRAGWPACSFSEELPDNWPPGHVWAGLDEWHLNEKRIGWTRSRQYRICAECDELGRKALGA